MKVHQTSQRTILENRRLLIVVLLVVVGLVSVSATGVAQDSSGPTPAETRALGISATGDQRLPVTAVSLFTTGVGYFQHDGVVDGDETVTLTVSSGDINDLLKSLVLQDLDGGRVELVAYPSQDPLQRILNSFSLPIGDNPALETLLIRARGEEVSLDGPVSVTGTIFGIEYKTITEGDVTRRETLLNLLVGGEFRQVALGSIRSLRFGNPALQQELDSALAVIAENRQQDRKSISIRFAGQGSRRVRIGYIREVPVWKSTYRLVIQDDGTAQLQGWAIVENTGEIDWEDVRLSLIAQRPISFVMDLYSPVYNQRPRVQPNIGVSVAPPSYDRGIAQAPSAPSAARSMAPGYAAEEALSGAYADDFDYYADKAPEPMDLSQGVSAAVLAGEAAAFTISHGVSIPRRGAALIPIVSATIPIERLAIYDPSTLGNRPLSGLRMSNEIGTQLLAGPITIFDGARYAGDARLPDLVPGEERLLSYAIDLETTVLVRSQSIPQEIIRVRVTRGILETTLRQEQTTEYVFDRISSDDSAEGVPYFFFHPKRSGWEFIGEIEPTDETASQWRFQIDAPPTGTVTAEIVEEYVRSQTYSLVSLSDDQIVFYLSQQSIDRESVAQLNRIRELQRLIRTREGERRAIETEVNTIYREQQRIRSNMEVLDTTTDLYKRYLETFTNQEDRLEVLNRDVIVARQAEQDARDALSDYIESL